MSAEAVPAGEWISAGVRANRPPEEERVRRTKTALREAMVALVLEQGYDAVTVEALVERAGVTRAAFAAYFGTRNAC
ncbi:MAG: helix-turn-helix transcriptional regulator [Candidatus Microthrix sp.]|uniref:TetR/AcrR family transcriptional regulator n=1 Tax=Candidatus Neomicrothrix sp. TaxID=2719034 RepID=UPI0025C6C8FC|nr:helix-turn-helix domain-containing protein [Candidatus Microthrix sp.]MBL0205741.1 helix-turn-helix transcriptional regulator [Candidatus Microthrix sp.]